MDDDNSIVVHTPSPISQEKTTASSTNSLHYSTENEFDEDLYTKSSNASGGGGANPSPLPTQLINVSGACSGCSSSALSASSSASSSTNKYTFILNAFVNGFVQLKLCANKVDFEYIIEVYWSNENKTFIKRTYDDFYKFHQCLMQAFERLFGEQSKSKKVLTGVCCHELLIPPVLPANKKPFWTSHLKLAESREIELNEYVQRLIKLPIQISHSSIVLKFFQSQTSDPKPAHIDFGLSNHSSSSIAKTSSSLINTTKNSTDSLEYDDDDDDDDRDESENNSNYDSDYLPNDENIDMDHNSLSNSGSVNEASSSEESGGGGVGAGANGGQEESDSAYFFEEMYTVNQSEVNQPANKLASSSFTTTSSSRRNKPSSIVIDRPEAGLWWDEDIALTNELTLSKSFSQYNLNKGNYQLTSSRLNQEMSNCKKKQEGETVDDQHNEEEEEEDDEEMRTLEAIIKNSELFCNLANKSKQHNKRFSLA